MSQPNKPDPRGFKPGANMPQDGYDPKTQGMSDSGNHATGHPGNDTPSANHANQQSAAAAATATTHRDKNAGARGDDSSHTNQSGNRNSNSKTNP